MIRRTFWRGALVWHCVLGGGCLFVRGYLLQGGCSFGEICQRMSPAVELCQLFSLLSNFCGFGSYRRQSHICHPDEWVNEWMIDGNNRIPILTQFWPNVLVPQWLLFISEYLSGLTFTLDTQLSSLLLWFQGYSHEYIMLSSLFLLQLLPPL